MKTQENILLLADAYKYSHHKLYYPGTSRIYSYLESRGGQFDETVFFGLQYFLKHYLQGKVITKQKIDEAEIFLQEVFGRKDVFDRKNFDYILQQHNGGLPVRIRAVPEGTVVPVNNVLMTIENTDPNCFWLTNFLETLLMQVWYPSTVATLSRAIKKVVEEYYNETASLATAGSIEFVLNDFGFRGVSSVESAGLGAAAHLLNFRGSDTIMGSVLACRYYNADKVYGLSVPATEHSVCTLLGKEGELEVFKHVLKTFPTGVIACVSDSFDIFRACSEYWGEELKELVLSRDGVLVIRPDSGDPVFTLLKVFEILLDKFGYTLNEKGYKVLPPQVRVIQGDGINFPSIRAIYGALKVNGISAENLVLGMGGALLQKPDRDTQKFALKCSYAEVNGKPVEVMKEPLEINEHGRLVPSFKKSKAGRLKLIHTTNGYETVREETMPEYKDQLATVFENGELLNTYSFENIRKLAGKRKEMGLTKSNEMIKQNKIIAEDTLELLKQGYYSNKFNEKVGISDALNYAVKNTCLYTPEELERMVANIENKHKTNTLFEVVNETTLNAARALASKGIQDIMCLNFASAKNPGGGFLSGATAQEESIARASGLYYCLVKKEAYYKQHRQQRTCLYSDHMIYSPAVPVLKDEDGNVLDTFLPVNILTSAAVNAGAIKKNEPSRITQIIPVMRSRIEKMLALCVAKQQQVLILGAWGCGVFQNDPAVMAELFHEALTRKFAGQFQQVVFAIKTRNESMIEPFRKLFSTVEFVNNATATNAQ